MGGKTRIDPDTGELQESIDILPMGILETWVPKRD